MFIPRDPVVQNQFTKYAAQTDTTGGAGNVIAYAGSVVYLDPSAPNYESHVLKMTDAAGNINGSSYAPFGLLMQKVKTGYHSVHPVGYMMPGDMGSSDAIAQPSYNSSGTITGTAAAPAGVAHLGIWDTVHYTCNMTASTIASGDEMTPGDKLYPAADEAKLTNSTTASTGTAADDKAAGARCDTTQVATVVAGAALAKCQANFDNTTLFPIRVKLLI